MSSQESLMRRDREVLQNAAHFFNSEAFSTISNGYLIAEFENAISQFFDSALVPQTATSVDDFFEKTSHVFSSSFRNMFKLKCQEFDSFCGGPVADVFIADRPLETRTYDLAWNTLMSIDRAIEDQDQIYRQDSAISFHLTGTPQGNENLFAPFPVLPAPITQIHLKGNTVKEAWQQDPDTRRMASFEQVVTRDWTPATPGDAPVFHGTTSRLARDAELDQMISTKPSTIGGKSGKTQLYPFTATNLRGIFTSFSAMRSFLWAVFESEVVLDPPCPTALHRLQRNMVLRGQNYQGVVVVKFNSNQPTSQRLRHYQIPAGKETDWQKACTCAHYFTEPWSLPEFRIIHQQNTTEFPDILQGKDLPRLDEALRGFPCNRELLWQTAWMEPRGARALNERIEEIFVISFEFSKSQGSLEQ